MNTCETKIIMTEGENATDMHFLLLTRMFSKVVAA